MQQAISRLAALARVREFAAREEVSVEGHGRQEIATGRALAFDGDPGSGRFYIVHTTHGLIAENFRKGIILPGPSTAGFSLNEFFFPTAFPTCAGRLQREKARVGTVERETPLIWW